MSDSYPTDRALCLRVPAMPAHTNAGGDIFGGWIMAQIDIAGSLPAVQRARGNVVTVAVKHMHFIRPVRAGDMVSIFAQIAEVGRTSMTVDLEVYVERQPQAPQIVRVAEAQLVYVAVDNQGRPRPVDTPRGVLV